MVSVQSPPGGREVPYARVLLLPAVLMAAATGAAVAVVTEPARIAVALCGTIGTLVVIAVAAEAVRRGRTARELRRQYTQRIDHLERRVAAQDELTERVGKDLIPRALAMTGRGAEIRDAMSALIDQDPEYHDLPKAWRTVTEDVLTIVEREELLRESVQASFVHIARRVQAIVHQQAKELREMEYDHGRNPDVFDDLLRLDHGNSLIGRLADSISVLGGGRPGRQWPKPIRMYSVLRGAMSRILEYPRITLQSIAEVAVKGTHAEPVIHACAELLDNATRYSPPNTKVYVTATEVQAGVAIEIEDAGVTFTEEARDRIERIIGEAQAGFALQDFTGSPQLGLAVIGRLTKTHNMQISLRPSAYGGIRAILVVPHDMLTTAPPSSLAHGIGATAVPRPDTGGVEGPKRVPKKRRPTTGPRRVPSAEMPIGVTSARQMEDEDVPVVTEWTENGLPQRRSKATIPITEQIRAAYAEKYAEEERLEREAAERAKQGLPEPPPEPDPVDDEPPPGLWVDDFMKGLKGEYDVHSTPDPAKTAARTEAGDVTDGGDRK